MTKHLLLAIRTARMNVRQAAIRVYSGTASGTSLSNILQASSCSRTQGILRRRWITTASPALSPSANDIDFSSITTYPKLPAMQTGPAFPTRPVYPVFPPPLALATQPAFPSPRLSITPHSPFDVSTHIVPAAWLRTTPYIPLPKMRNQHSRTEERKNAAVELQAFLSKVRSEASATIPGKRRYQGHKRLLWNAVNRYVKKGAIERSNGGSALTLFFAHGNGFNKETWESTLHHIFEDSSSHNIAEVWSFEAVQTGDSALLNADALGAMYHWADNSRDILNFLTHFMPSTVSSNPPPTRLRQVTAAESESRRKDGFKHRTVAGIGHSFGGCTLTLAALTNQSIFSSIIVVDPVIPTPLYYEAAQDPFIPKNALGILLRRDRWDSRDEAKAWLLKNPFFANWHPDVLQSYVDHGLYTHKSGKEVLLKMSPVQEAIGFSDTLTGYEVWERMKDLDPKIPMFWIMPQPETNMFGGPFEAQKRVWRRCINTSNTIIHKAGHLIPHEAPQECANAIMRFLSK